MSEYDYIVVGSGAGGGPLAANLARKGFRVLLLEAGGDPCAEDGPGRFLYQVPIFHGLSTESSDRAWNYYVRHYTSDAQQAKDSKKVSIARRDTIWYPRAGALGGCTTHHAMITVVAQDNDWNQIADITGDDSWRAEQMREYFARLENCKYVKAPAAATAPDTGGVQPWAGEAVAAAGAAFEKTISTIGSLLGKEDWRTQTHGHGFNGWLPTSEADPKLALKDPELIGLLLNCVQQALVAHVGNPRIGIESRLDPNDSRNTGDSPEGLAFTPLAVENGKRTGPREFLLSVQNASPDKLTIRQHALATRVLFEGAKAVGVEYIEAAHAYGADPQALADPSAIPRTQVQARLEVIVSGGAFNSPQLLMLSGVGPRDQLDKFGIPVVADLPGVGSNLQDRYEVGVISEFKRDFALIEKALFKPPCGDPDSAMTEWEKDGSGLYASNGSLIGMIKRSSRDLADPDLYIFGLPGYFAGYKPGYSTIFERHRNRFTWAILKARTRNTGRVMLQSPHPWDTPSINFQYFGDGARDHDPDLEAVVNGVHFARAMNHRLADLGLIVQEDVPGDTVGTDDQLREFIRNEAWGHHASCTNKIGADDDPMAVLDSRFRVRKTKGLRVVDASVFPSIPGYFIVTPVYMISEKASDVIAEDAH